MKMNYVSIKRMEELRKIILSLAAIATLMSILTIELLIGISSKLSKGIGVLVLITDVTVLIRVLILNRQIRQLKKFLLDNE